MPQEIIKLEENSCIPFYNVPFSVNSVALQAFVHSDFNLVVRNLSNKILYEILWKGDGIY